MASDTDVMNSDKNTFRGRLLENWAVIVAIFYICITIFGCIFSYIIYGYIGINPFHFFDLNDFLLSGLKTPETILSAIALTAAICSKVFFGDIIEERCNKYLFWILIGTAFLSFLMMIALTRDPEDRKYEISYICTDSQTGPATIIAIAQISNNFIFANKMQLNDDHTKNSPIYVISTPDQTLIFNKVKVRMITLPKPKSGQTVFGDKGEWPLASYPKDVSCKNLGDLPLTEGKPERSSAAATPTAGDF